MGIRTQLLRRGGSCQQCSALQGHLFHITQKLPWKLNWHVGSGNNQGISFKIVLLSQTNVLRQTEPTAAHVAENIPWHSAQLPFSPEQHSLWPRCNGFKEQSFGHGGGYRDGFSDKLPEASPLADRAKASWLQDRQTHCWPSQASQWEQQHLWDNAFRKREKYAV